MSSAHLPQEDNQLTITRSTLEFNLSDTGERQWADQFSNTPLPAPAQRAVDSRKPLLQALSERLRPAAVLVAIRLRGKPKLCRDRSSNRMTQGYMKGRGHLKSQDHVNGFDCGSSTGNPRIHSTLGFKDQERDDFSKSGYHSATNDLVLDLECHGPLGGKGHSIPADNMVVEPEVLLTLRSHNLRVSRATVSLPGGKSMPGESPVETAFREAEEEVGIPASSLQLLGVEGEAFTFVGPGYRVSVVIALITDPHFKPRPQPGEVALTFYLPLSRFLGMNGLRQGTMFAMDQVVKTPFPTQFPACFFHDLVTPVTASFPHEVTSPTNRSVPEATHPRSQSYTRKVGHVAAHLRDEKMDVTSTLSSRSNKQTEISRLVNPFVDENCMVTTWGFTANICIYAAVRAFQKMPAFYSADQREVVLKRPPGSLLERIFEVQLWGWSSKL